MAVVGSYKFVAVGVESVKGLIVEGCVGVEET